MKPAVNLGNLDGPEGNAFSVLGRCRQAAKNAGWDQKQVNDFIDLATADDYDHLLKVVKKSFDVFVAGRPVRLT